MKSEDSILAQGPKQDQRAEPRMRVTAWQAWKQAPGVIEPNRRRASDRAQISDMARREISVASMKSGLLWQQDNAPYSPFQTKRASRIRFLPCPARSPDLSAMKHMWAWLKNQITGLSLKNAEELFETRRMK
jgi:hypothetical protein